MNGYTPLQFQKLNNMKTFRFIGVGLFAVLLSFTFTACGDDEEEDLPKDPTTENITPSDSTQNKPTEVP